MPSCGDSGVLTVGANQTETIGPGSFQYTSLTAKSRSGLTILGPCNLVITTGVTIHRGATWTFDATEGPIQVHALNDFRLHDDATIRTTVEDPARVTIYLTGVHDSADDRSPLVSLSSDAEFYGSLYAPDLSVMIANSFELFGRLEAGWVELANGARVHFDEHLASGELDPGADREVLAWRPLAGARAATE